MPKAKDYTGLKFNSITVLRPIGRMGKNKTLAWEVQCECGKVFSLPTNKLSEQKQQSCGCKTHGKANRKHGMSYHRAYHIWHGMCKRCFDPDVKAYKNYGGRGITVCDKWKNDFTAFWEDMQPTYAPTLTLERIDVNGNYSPENCVWATMKEQTRNMRKNVFIDTPWGRMIVADAADKSGVKRTTFEARLARGVNGPELFKPPTDDGRFKKGWNLKK